MKGPDDMKTWEQPAATSNSGSGDGGPDAPIERSNPIGGVLSNRGSKSRRFFLGIVGAPGLALAANRRPVTAALSCAEALRRLGSLGPELHTVPARDLAEIYIACWPTMHRNDYHTRCPTSGPR